MIVPGVEVERGMPKPTQAPSGEGTAKHKVADALASLLVPLDAVTLDPENTRARTPMNLQVIAASLSDFGQYRPIVVQRQGMIVRAGNGAVMAARSLGWTHMAAVVLDMTDAEATAYSITDNRSADLGRWNEPMLAEVLAELRERHRYTPEDMQRMGWTQDDLTAFPKAGDWQPSPDADGTLEEHTRGPKGVVLRLDVDRDQSEAIMQCVANARRERGWADASDGEVFAKLCAEYVEAGS